MTSLASRVLIVLTLAALPLAGNAQAADTTNTSTAKAPAPQLQAEVFKSPTCGCCDGWVEHLQSAGIHTQVHNQSDADLNATKIKFALAPKHQSCHTAVIDDYIFEGHVPATSIQQFLTNPPAGALGLTVPGMPVGSPGMEMGGRYDGYDVLQLNADGSTQVFQSISSEQSATMHRSAAAQ